MVLILVFLPGNQNLAFFECVLIIGQKGSKSDVKQDLSKVGHKSVKY